MSALFEENFELYGGEISRALEGVWAEFTNCALELPSFEEDGRYWLAAQGASQLARAVIASTSGLGVFFIFRVNELPEDDSIILCEIRDASNADILQLRITSIGNLEIVNSGGVTVAATTTPCFTASTIHKVQFQANFGASGNLEVRVGTVGGGAPTTVIDEDPIAISGTASQVGLAKESSPVTRKVYYKCFAAYSLTGTYNSNWPSISGVRTLMINEDTATDNLTPRYREIFNAGVARQTAVNDALFGSNNTSDFNFGTGDFTLEGYFRWETLPVSAEQQVLASLWNDGASNERGWKLSFKADGLDDGGLQWEHTTDGETGTRTIVHRVNWTPVAGHIYHIAVSRDSGVSRIFIDGVQQGLDVADTADIYAAGANAKFMLGNACNSNSPTGFGVTFNGAFRGEWDEVRVTTGVGRYTSNFTPAGPWPRSVSGGDSDFASVTYLAGYDNAIATDESSYERAMSTHDNTARYVPQDGDGSFTAARDRDPLDDRYLEAALIPASGIFTLTDNPSDTETVTLGSITYEFVTTLSSANDVLIGADLEETLDNLEAAINGGAGEGTTYGSGTTPNTAATAENGVPTVGQLTATAISPGTSGNSIASTETCADGSWGDTTLDGGADLPGASTFGVESLPATVTGVRWVSLRNRSRLTQGSGKVQATFIVSGDEDAGTEHDLTSGFVNYMDRFEEDPDTSAGLTPTSIVNAQIKLERTE